jgi:hypothetical protein
MKPDAEWSDPRCQAQFPSQQGPCGPAVSSFYGLENVGMMSAFGTVAARREHYLNTQNSQTSPFLRGWVSKTHNKNGTSQMNGVRILREVQYKL